MAVGLGIIWVGYTLTYFGFCSLRGPGVGLLDLVIPGRTIVIPGAGGAGDSGANISTPGATLTGPGGDTLYTGPTGSQITHGKYGDSIEPQGPNPGATYT